MSTINYLGYFKCNIKDIVGNIEFSLGKELQEDLAGLEGELVFEVTDHRLYCDISVDEIRFKNY